VRVKVRKKEVWERKFKGAYQTMLI